MNTKALWISCLMFLVMFLTPVFSYSQNENCPKIKVGIKLEIYDWVYEQLNKDYPSKSNPEWLRYIESELMRILKENSPELEFISLSPNPSADHDYLVDVLIALTGGGEDIEVYPEETIIDGDNIFIIPPVYRSEYTVYKVWFSLIVNSHCFPNRRYILMVEKGESQDIIRAIYSSLPGREITYYLYERESKRPVPPREPRIDTWIDGEYLSPLTLETRKIKIYEKVLSCNWQPAYWKFYHAQPVRFPYNTERGHIEPKENCKLELQLSEIQYILVNEKGNAVGEYTLEKGLDPLKEEITLSTCPLGNKPDIERKVEVIIRGLEMTVVPEKKKIFKGETTEIKIDLHEIDPDGNKYPAENQKIEIEVTGLVDGSIDPQDKVTTDGEGLATITYKSGQKEKNIKITATFSPPDYPDKVKAEAEISLIDMVAIHVRETESGAIKGDDGSTSYPYNYTVAMQFRGKIINSKSLFQTVAKLPDALRKMVMKEGSMSLKEECTLIAELEPDEKSMKVEKWECSDPINNTPPPPLLGTHPAEFDVPTRIWQIGQKIYISHGFLEGILSYFPSWEDPRSSNSKEPAGARADGPSGEMGEYIEVPYEKFINGETITLKPKDVSDHNDDEWQWNTHWTVTINPD